MWTLPSEAVSSGRRQRVDDRAAGRAATVDLEGEHPAGHARPELAQRRRRAGDGSGDPGRGRRARHPDARASAASAAAVAAWRSTRTARVRIPRRTRNASSGPSVAPVSIWTRSTSAISSGDPATTPAMTSLWPPRNFVADSTTRSAPSSSGRQTYGEANVLSTTYVAPWRWASVGERRVIGDERRRVGDGLRVEDARRRGRERRRDRVEVGRVDEVDRGPRSRRTCRSSWLRVEPYDRERRDDPVAGADERRERGVDRGHPRRERDARPRRRRARRRRSRGRSSSGSRCGCRRSPPRPSATTRRARRRRPRRTSRSGRSGRSSGSGRASARATPRGWRGSRSPGRSGPGRGVGCRSRSDATPETTGRPGAGHRDAGDAVLAGALRGVHRAVGADHQLVGRPAVVAGSSRRRSRATVGRADRAARSPSRGRRAGSSRPARRRRSDRSRAGATTNSSPP